MSDEKKSESQSIRIDADLYRAIIKKKAQIELKKQSPVTLSEALRELITK